MNHCEEMEFPAISALTEIDWDFPE